MIEHPQKPSAPTTRLRCADECACSPRTVPHDSILPLCRQFISGFLKRIMFTRTVYSHNPELASRVQAIVQQWNIDAASIRPHTITAIVGTITAYGHITNIGTQVQIALFTTIILALDDAVILDSMPSRDFHRMFSAGAVEGGADLLGELQGLLPGMWDHYSRFAASAIVTSALDFMNVTILENETKEMTLSSDGAHFLVYRRTKTATAEAYAHFIWEKTKFPDVQVYVQAIPDVMMYVNCVNDILSFYKEELAGETGNYIGDRSAIEGRTVLEILREMIDETVAATERIRHILGEGEARGAWESFARGYISAHICSPRYRLQDILGEHHTLD